ncbi:MAG: inositol-3-phosphate synthase [Planctomycetota bacterium]|nr:inositol-3-phosphate synthase [Planctomycetota bacterium]
MRGKTGVWLIGACGNVGMLTVVGARAIARGLAGRTGLVTELREFRDLALPGIEDLVFGGHEIGAPTLAENARDFSRRAGVIQESLLNELSADLETAQGEIRDGFPSRPVRTLTGKRQGPAGPAAVVKAIRDDIDAFKERNGLRDVVVVNVATTEPQPEPRREWDSLTALRRALEDDRAEIFPPSMLYAYAALDAGYPYVNFTPSTGSSVAALDELARARGTVHAGRDGKTGETLVKTTLAPLFAARNLRVHAWEGYNMLGNPDGAALRDPATRNAKAVSKDRSLRSILGEHAGHSSVHIDFVPSLDDWKVAFDYIHFEGFLGAKMAMQFTWQGCDSALAAPLVLDLARLAAFAHAHGESGAMTHLACFFKDPAGTDVHAFADQFELLRAYAGRALKRAQSA